MSGATATRPGNPPPGRRLSNLAPPRLGMPANAAPKRIPRSSAAPPAIPTARPAPKKIGQRAAQRAIERLTARPLPPLRPKGEARTGAGTADRRGLYKPGSDTDVTVPVAAAPEDTQVTAEMVPDIIEIEEITTEVEDVTTSRIREAARRSLPADRRTAALPARRCTVPPPVPGRRVPAATAAPPTRPIPAAAVIATADEPTSPMPAAAEAIEELTEVEIQLLEDDDFAADADTLTGPALSTEELALVEEIDLQELRGAEVAGEFSAAQPVPARPMSAPMAAVSPTLVAQASRTQLPLPAPTQEQEGFAAADAPVPDLSPKRRRLLPIGGLILGLAVVGVASYAAGTRFAGGGDNASDQTVAPSASAAAVATDSTTPPAAPIAATVATLADEPPEAPAEETAGPIVTPMAPEDAESSADPADAEETETVKAAPKPVRPERSKPTREADRPPRSEEMSQSRPSPVADGILMLASKPPCGIIIDGVKTGLTTPQRSIPLKPGRHKITLVNSEHELRETFSVSVASDKRTRILKDLTSQIDSKN